LELPTILPAVGEERATERLAMAVLEEAVAEQPILEPPAPVEAQHSTLVGMVEVAVATTVEMEETIQVEAAVVLGVNKMELLQPLVQMAVLE